MRPHWGQATVEAVSLRFFPSPWQYQIYQPFLVFRMEPLVLHRYQSQLLAAPVPGHLSPSALQELQDHESRRACPPLTLARCHPPPSLQEHWAEAAALGSPAGLACFRLGAAGGSVNRRSVKAGMACSGSSAAHTS